MGRRAKTVQLTQEEKEDLEVGYHQSSNARFSQRCHMILLKSQGRTSKELETIFNSTYQSINSWVKRYEAEGIAGLQTRPGRGRPRILNKQTDRELIERTVKQDRQRLSVAKEQLSQQLNKEFSMSTLTRFLKALAVPTDVSD